MWFRFYVVLIIFGTQQVAIAQIQSDAVERQILDSEDHYLSPTPVSKGLLHTSISVEAASDAITNQFFNSFMLGKNIDTKQKDDVSSKLHSNNRIGYELNFSLNGIYHTPKFAYLAGIGHRELLDGKFTSALFETVFRGNKQFAGKEVALGPSYAHYLNYDYIYIGGAKSIKSTTLYAAIQLIRGGQLMQADWEKGNMYTESMGEYINLDVRAKLNYSSSDFSTFPSTSGLGSAINLGVSHQTDKHAFNLELRDLGFIHWQNQQSFQIDSTYRYDGVEVNDLFNDNLLTSNTIDIDSISKNINIPKKANAQNIILPATLLANYQYTATERLKLFLGVKHVFSTNTIPKVTFRLSYQLPKKWYVIPAISYGGYGRQNVEVGVVKIIKESFVVSANVFCLEYLLLKKQTLAGGLKIGLTMVF